MIFEHDYYQISKENLGALPPELLEQIVPILEPLVWTGIDSDMAIDGVLESGMYPGLDIPPEVLTDLKAQFAANGFDEEAILEMINNKISCAAFEFIRQYLTSIGKWKEDDADI